LVLLHAEEEDVLPAELEKLGRRLLSPSTHAHLTMLFGPSFQQRSLTITGGDAPASEELSYELGSVTKVLTALLMAQLSTDGRLKFADPLGSYFPGLPDHLREITLVQLASHTSGLPRLPPDLKLGLRGRLEWPNPYSHFTDDRLLDSLARVTPRTLAAPNKVLYSNFGYALLGLALSKAANEPFESAMCRRVLRPLGMDSTSFANDFSSGIPLAQGYDRHGRRVMPWRNPTFSPAGGLRAPLRDLNLMLETFLAPSSSPISNAIELTMSPIRIDELVTVGLGWQIRVTSSLRYLFWHNGSSYGSSAVIIAYPSASSGVAAVASIGHAPELDEIAMLMMRMSLKSSPP
jgi:CubicO group peptidase (beta-lactamase class C family)